MEEEDPGGFQVRAIKTFAAELTEVERAEARERFRAAHLPLRAQMETLAYQVEMSKRAERLQSIAESVEGR
jgi:hypothetical protein